MKLGQLKATMESSMSSMVEDTDINNDLNPESQEHSDLGEDEVTGDDTAALMDEGVAEADAASAEIEGQDEALNHAFNAADTLDEIQRSAQNISTTNGAMTASAANMIETSMESIMKRLGLDPVEFPTVESYSSKYGSRDATRVTLESIGDSVKKAWDRLIAMLKELMNSVLQFLNRTLQNRTLLEKRIVSLQARARAIQSSQSQKSKDVRGPFVRGLTFRGVASGDTAWEVYQTAKTLIGGFELGVKAMDELRDAATPVDGKSVHLIKSYFEISLGSDNLQFSVRDGSEDTELFGALPNGMSLAFRDGTGIDSIYYHTNRGKQKEAPTSMEALDVSDILSLLGANLRVIQDLKKVESRTGRLTDAVRGLIRRLESEYHRLRGATGNADHTAKYEAQKSARAMQLILTKVISRFPSSAFMSVKYSADYCEACIRNYRTEVK